MKPEAPNQNPSPLDGPGLKNLWDWNFTNHAPTPDAIKKMEGLRSAAKAMKDAFIDMAPYSRERSLALTHLEEALFYANAAIARNENLDMPAPEKPDEDKALDNQPKQETK